MKTVLFVDDTPEILKVYRRLFEREAELRCFYVSSADAAFSYLSSTLIDIIITDIEMPFFNGKELLHTVKEKYPSTVRIIISGATLNKHHFEIVKLAHRFFRKPTNLTSLLSAIHHTLFVQNTVIGMRARVLLGNITTIPTYPLILERIEKELSSQNGSLKNIGKIISEDPSLTSGILKIVNSDYFNLPQKVISPEHAVAMVGLEGVKGLILSQNVVKEIPENLCETFDVKHFCHHSYITAQLAKEIALLENLPNEEVEVAFVSGLLHDIGRLILEINFTDDEIDIKNHLKSVATKGDLSILEKNNIGVSHAEAGAYILGLWGLRDDLIEVIAMHHNPSNYRKFNNPQLLSLLHCADIFAYELFPKSEFEGLEELDITFLKEHYSLDKVESWRAHCLKVVSNFKQTKS